MNRKQVTGAWTVYAAPILVFVVCLLAANSLRADDFDWSCQKEAEASEAKPVAAPKADEEKTPDAVAEADDEPPPPLRAVLPSAAGAPVVVKEASASEGVGAEYQQLIRENLELKRKVDEAARNEQVARRENEKLASEIKGFESKIGQMGNLVKDLQDQKTKVMNDPERVKELESKLAVAEKEKAGLMDDLKRVRKEAEAKPAPAPARPPVKASDVPVAQAGVQPGSDLFKEKEKENTLLKQKLVGIEIERQKAVKARDDIVKRTEKAEEDAKLEAVKRKELEAKLLATVAAQKETGKTIDKLMEQIPGLEKELKRMKSEADSKEGQISEKERNLKAMEVELQKREQRLIKADRMTELLEKTQEDVAKVSDREKRDMHYNMAVVYAREGRCRDAEREYLHALRIDPNDPAVHYNLGILYDDELNDKERAAMHYRKYLKLSPHGTDVDAVKSWLMKLETTR